MILFPNKTYSVCDRSWLMTQSLKQKENQKYLVDLELYSKVYEQNWQKSGFTRNANILNNTEFFLQNFETVNQIVLNFKLFYFELTKK